MSIMGRIEVVKLLLSRGVSHGIRDNSGETALHAATSLGRVETFEVFFKNEIATEKGRNYDILINTVGSGIALYGKRQILKLLLACQQGGPAAVGCKLKDQQEEAAEPIGFDW